ncbi:hypothetical protein PPACK8108_LOCUS22317 [Phakopsora pachyrhizi]|uniref:Rab-GAP TBC domain-containing protein n=1 Tax=Phakopsora pachyrhizi TaxID=170000 RepID=A0AAV0BKF4_PHAPC|nr:hypothetical protein PPACK8108_LOCUS22317 [Phakopsora pachyrhizi]
MDHANYQSCFYPQALLNSSFRPQAQPRQSNSKLELELSSINPSQNQNTDESYKFTYQDLLTRLLTVWSALNPGISYVQGMNLIGSVLIYIYKNTNLRNHSTPGQPVHHSDCDIKDTREEDLSKHFENVEADTFWAFNSLMSPIRLLFIKSFDNDQPSFRPSQMSPGTKSSLVFAYNPEQIQVGHNSSNYSQNSQKAIKLNTMTHQAQKTSEEDDSNQVLDYLVDLSCVMTLRGSNKIGDEEIEDEPFWEEDFEEDGFNKYKGPWLGTLISRLASRFPWTPDTQQKNH